MITKTHLRVILALLFVVVCLVWIVPTVRHLGSPEYDWERAQAAHQRDELETAKIHLQNLLSKDPEHDRGHEMMAEVLLSEAQSLGQAATFAANPSALAHLVEAAKLRQGDSALQARLLTSYLAMGRMPEAARIAERLEQSDTANPPAVFALAWRATLQRDVATAETLFERLKWLPSRRVFQTKALAVDLYESTGHDQELDETLSLVANLARNLEPEKLALLVPLDRDVMCQLLVRAVAQAADLATARDRATAALQGCEKLGAASLQTPAVLASTAGRVVLLLDEKYPLAPHAGDDEQPRRQLHTRAAALGNDAIDAGTAEPLVYRQVALTLFGNESDEDDELAVATLRQGIAAGEKLDDAGSKELLDLHMLAARMLVNRRSFSAAQPHVEALLADKDTVGWGHLLAGTIDFHAGQLEKALRHYQQADRLLGGTRFVRAALANAYLALGRWRLALDNLASLQADFRELDAESVAWAQLHLGSEAQVQFGMLQAHLALNQWEQANRQLEQLEDTPFEARGTAAMVAFLWQHQRADEASAMLAAAAQKSPSNALLLRLGANLLQRSGKPAEADALVERAVAASPDNLAIQLVWCQRRIARGQTEDAIQRLASLAGRLDSPQEQLSLKVHQAQALLLAGDSAGAAATLETLRDDPRFATAAGLLGAAAQLQQDDLPAATQALQAAREIGPQHGLIRLLAGQLALATGDYQTAIDELGEVIDVTVLRESAGRALFHTLQLMSARESPAAAVAKIDTLLEHSPEHPILLMAKADLLIRQNQFNAGIALLRDVQRLQPDDPTASLLAAAALLQRNRPGNALRELRVALEIAPRHTASLLLASRACLAARRNQEAYDYASAALAVDPGLWQAELLQSDSLRALNRSEQAAEILIGLIDGEQQPAAAFTQLANIHRSDEQLDQALEVCRTGRATLPGDFSLQALEVELVAASGSLDEAWHLAMEALCEMGAFENHLELAAVFARGGHFPEAQKLGLEALGLATETQAPDAHLLLGKVVRHLSRANPDPDLVKQARDHFAAVVAVSPRHVDATNNLAWLLATEFQQPHEAARLLENLWVEDDAVDRLPVAVLDTIGVVYRQADRAREVEPVFKAALRLRPNHPTLLFHLGVLQAASHKPQFASFHLQQALEYGLEGPEASAAKQKLAALAEDNERPDDQEAAPPNN